MCLGPLHILLATLESTLESKDPLEVKVRVRNALEMQSISKGVGNSSLISKVDFYGRNQMHEHQHPRLDSKVEMQPISKGVGNSSLISKGGFYGRNQQPPRLDSKVEMGGEKK